MPTCPHLHLPDLCKIATELAARPAATNPSACQFCSGLPDANQVNQVTVSMALGAVAGDRDAARRIQAEYGHLIAHGAADADETRAGRLTAIAAGTGPGSQLWRLLESLGVRHTATCVCLSLAERMNAWGPAGCRLARLEIVDQMRTNAKDYGWGTVAKAAAAAVLTGLAWKLDLADLYGSLLDEAIRRAEAANHALPIVSPP